MAHVRDGVTMSPLALWYAPMGIPFSPAGIAARRPEATVPSSSRHHDDARRDTNFAIAHLWVALLGGLSMLGCLIWRCIAQPRRVLRPASRRAGGSARRVKFDTQEDAVRGTPLKASPVRAESLTTRHHRRRGKHPLVEPSGTSPVAAKARYPHGPRPW